MWQDYNVSDSDNNIFIEINLQNRDLTDISSDSNYSLSADLISNSCSDGMGFMFRRLAQVDGNAIDGNTYQGKWVFNLSSALSGNVDTNCNRYGIKINIESTGDVNYKDTVWRDFYLWKNE